MPVVSATLPLDPAEVARCLDPAWSGSMLPRGAYLDQAVLDFEREQIFAAGWVYVGRSELAAEPGDRAAIAIGDEGVLLVRGRDRQLRCFANVCRHRGHELLPCGTADSGRFVACPYHAWVYDLDGTLHQVPAAHRPDVPAADYPLLPVAVTEWHGFVFANLTGTPPPLDQAAPGLAELIAPYRCAELKLGAGHSYDLAANWKLAVENYHECFHCPGIHPQLCRVSSPTSGADAQAKGLWCGGSMELEPGVETMALDGRSLGVPIEGLAGEALRTVWYLQVFPNLLLSLHPDYVMTHRLVPVEPGLTRVECEWLFPAVAWDRPGFDPAYAVEFWDVTNRQDWAACESVQRGLTARRYTPGPLSSYHEVVVRASIEMVARAYLAGMPGGVALAG
ncbi:MAG: aromatic ring-hydroxylating dioxygenase subunit alpha [Sporichthyaceae bacterium]|nr:aromatic ring-hydroxylating dioxygenase subunit alpha [Sporichthyaceae bacterium]